MADKVFELPELDREKAKQEFDKAMEEYRKAHAGDTEKKEKGTSVVERAALKEAINKERPGTMKYKGWEKIYEPDVRSELLGVGDAAGAVLAYLITQGATNLKTNSVNNYLASGRSPETRALANKIVKSNREIMSLPPTVDGQITLMANTILENRLPKDNLSDLTRIMKNDPRLPKSKMEKIKKGTLSRWEANQKPLNNLEATRPGNDVWAHSLNTASDFGVLLSEAFPEMSSKEIARRVEAAKLHDYGKGMVRQGDLITSANFRAQPELNAAKKVEVDAHSVRGAKALESIGEDLAAKYAKEHHGKPDDFELQLLKAADVFNAITMERVYKGPKTAKEALKIMKKDVEKGIITPEAYAVVEKAVKKGKLREPAKFDSILEDVYATEAANAAKEKGIKLFDVNLLDTKFARGVATFNSIIAGILAGQGLKTASDLSMDKVSKKVKRNALAELYKDDKDTYYKIKTGYYTDKEIDQVFKDNVDRIIENQKES